MGVAARSRSKVAHTPVVCEFPRASDQHRDAKPIEKLPATSDATNIPSRPLHWAITCPAVFAAAAVTVTRQRRRQISDDENPNHFVFGHGWLPKEGCKICIECRQRNDPVGLALDIAHNRARHYADEVLQAAGAPTSPGGRYLLPAGFPSPTPS